MITDEHWSGKKRKNDFRVSRSVMKRRDEWVLFRSSQGRNHNQHGQTEAAEDSADLKSDCQAAW